MEGLGEIKEIGLKADAAFQPVADLRRGGQMGALGFRFGNQPFEVAAILAGRGEARAHQVRMRLGDCRSLQAAIGGQLSGGRQEGKDLRPVADMGVLGKREIRPRNGSCDLAIRDRGGRWDDQRPECWRAVAEDERLADMA